MSTKNYPAWIQNSLHYTIENDEQFTYKSKDGELVVGTAQHIGETVSAWWGDHNTPEFWWEFASEDDDHQVPAEYTLAEMIEFLASVEDRHPAHVARDIERYDPEAGRNPEIVALLGDTSVTPEQYTQIENSLRQIDARFPGKDAADDREIAANAALQIILGDVDLEDVGVTFLRARAVYLNAQRALTGAIIAADAQGATEAEIVQGTTVARGTVRKALGK